MQNKFGIMVATKSFETSDEESIKELAAAGFEASFYGWNEETDFFGKKKLFDKYNIEIDSIHAPFNKLNCIWEKDNPDGDAYIERLKKCIDDVSEIQVPYVVVHPICGDGFPRSNKKGMDRMRRLVDHSLKKNVKICFENVEYSEMLCICMHEFGNDVGFCYDTGHEFTNDPGIRYVPLFSDRLCCTHIHDNYGLSHIITPILHGDCHMIPLDAKIDFKRVMKDIRNANYKGTLMLECSRHGMLGTYPNYTQREFYERAYSALSEIASY